MKTGTKKFKTERLTLRRFQPWDYFSAQKWYCDARTSYYSQGRLQKSKLECLRLVLGRVYRYIKEPNTYYYWAISLSGKAIGLLEMQPMKTENVYSVYYMISPEHWGNGYATEAFRGAMEYMKGQKAVRLYATCNSENIASYRVIEKCGLTWLRRVENDLHYQDGRTGDREVFAIKLNNE